MRRTLLLSLLLLFVGVTMRAQDDLTLTFNRPSSTKTSADVEVLVNGTVREGATFGSSNSSGVTVGLKSGGKVTNAIITPDVNVGSGNTSIMTFTIPGLTAGTVYDNVVLKIHATNGSNAYQVADRKVTIDIKKGSGDDAVSFCEIEDKILTGAGSKAVHFTEAETGVQESGLVVSDEGTLVFELEISRGSETNGYFFGLEEIRLYAPGPANPEDVQTAIAEAEAILALKGVGYPLENSETRTTLRAAIDDFSGVATPLLGELRAFNAAIATYKSSTDIVLPSEGVFYKITNALSGFTSTKELLAGETDGAMDLRWGPAGEENSHYWKITDGKLMSANGYYVTYNGETGDKDNTGVFSMTTDATAAASVVVSGAGDIGKLSLTFSNGTNTSNPLHVKGHSSGSGTEGTIIAYHEEGAGASSWRITPISDGIKVYSVSITSPTENVVLTRTDTEETAFNGGAFMTDGTFAEDGSDFEIVHITNYVGTVAVDNAAKTITVTYVEDLRAELQYEYDLAAEVLAKTGVGYPVVGGSAREALSNAMTVADGLLKGTEIITAEHTATLIAAINAYKTTTTDIQMPEDGKAYTITSVNKNGVQRYMNYTEGTGYDLVDRTDDPLPMTAVLICRDLGEGKYVFTNNAGKYFMWRGGGTTGYNDNKGYSDTYEFNADINAEVWVEKISAEATNVTVEQDALFGYMAIKGHRNIATANDKICYFVITTAGGYDQANAMFFDDGYSSALLIEEVTTDSPSQVKFAANLDGVGYVATYSAPYPTVVPEGKGVVAYYASQNTGSDVTMTPIEGAIPANTGVVLISESMQTVGMAPLAAEAPEALTTNLLRHSAGEATTISAESGKTAYILANGSEGVGFYAHDGSATQLKMNKSYLVIDTPTGGNAVKLVFGGTATGIEDAVEADDAAAPVYDLSGRKVSAPVKGGIYVKNGKKIIF